MEELDWSESIKDMQRNWIGKSKGAEVTFAIDGHDDALDRIYDSSGYFVRRHLLRIGA